MCHLNPPQDQQAAQNIAQEAFAQAMHVTRSIAHTSLQYRTPGSIVFGRDMHLDIPLVSNILALHKARQDQIDARLLRANSKRSTREYKVNDMVYILRARKPGDKAQLMKQGPFVIVQVHTNSNVTVRRSPTTTERISIRRITPA